MSHPASLFFGVFLCTLLLTGAMRALAKKLDFVSRPQAGRWSQQVVPLGGGIPLALSLLLGICFLGFQFTLHLGPPLLAIFVLGLIDDLKSVPASGKIVVQAIAASYVVSFGYVLPTPWPVLSIPLTVLWIVGLSNSVNLIDNMDGLSSGIGLVAALSFAAMFLPNNQNTVFGLYSLVIAGAAGGFLIHNFAPARIFMGDAGSLPLGFALATLATGIKIPAGSGPWFAYTSLAVLPLCVPLFDTALVTYTRKRSRRPFLLGGRDHSSHRLVAWGLSDRKAVFVLYGFGVIAGGASIIGLNGGVIGWITGLSITAIVFILFGVFLSDAAVDNSKSLGENERSILPGKPDVILYALEVIVDVAVVASIWTGSHYLRFQDTSPTAFQDYLKLTVIPLLPLLLSVKIASFFFCNLYRGVWRSISIEDVYDIFKAATLGTMFIVLGSALNDRLENLSRVVIITDWLLTFLGVLGTRAAIKIFRSWSTRLAKHPQKAALLGHPALSEFAAMSLGKKGYELVGVISNESQPGVTTLGPSQNIDDILTQHQISMLIVAQNCSSEELERLAQKGVFIQMARLEFD
jgi:UDP-GlcNAc:undecaprenyl-phosphate/decaprenyl-phosphate GlcNAc-1-phosphate transferase